MQDCSWYSEEMTAVQAADKLCGLEREHQDRALMCLSTSRGTDLIEKADCFKGATGLSHLEGMMAHPCVMEKFRHCGADCQVAKAAALEQANKTETTMLQNFTSNIGKQETRLAVIGSMKEISVAWESSNKGEVQAKLLAKIDSSSAFIDIPDDWVPPDAEIGDKPDPTKHPDYYKSKQFARTQVKDALALTPSFPVTGETVINNVNAAIYAGKRRIIESREGQSYVKTQFKKTRAYIKAQSNSELLGKTTTALSTAAGAIQKFVAGGESNIISGIFDLGSALSEFIPPPAGAVMGPICSIFGSLFGPGTVTNDAVIDEVKSQFSKQKKYLEGEFKKLNANLDEKFDEVMKKLDDITEEIDEQTKKLFERMEQYAELARRERRQEAIDGIIAEQESIEVLFEEQTAYLNVIEENTLSKDDIVYLGTQIDIFEGTSSSQLAKEYIRSYCQGTLYHEVLMVKSCSGLIMAYIISSTAREALLTRWAVIFASSDFDLGINAANAALMETRTLNELEFFTEIFYDRSEEAAKCDDDNGYGILSCLASGEAILLKDGMVSLNDDEISMLRTFVNSLGNEGPFTCPQAWKTCCEYNLTRCYYLTDCTKSTGRKLFCLNIFYPTNPISCSVLLTNNQPYLHHLLILYRLHREW